MKYCIDSSIIGTDRHLVCDRDGFSWVHHVPDETYHFTGTVKEANDWCLDSLLKLSGVSIDPNPPLRFVNSMSVFSGSLEGMHVPWQKIMPDQEHRVFVRHIVSSIEGCQSILCLEYFETAWRAANAVLRSLQPCYVNKQTWRELVELNEGNVPALRSFEPNLRSRSPLIVYNRFGTLTGRLTVVQGPQILTLKREHRRMLRSRYGDDGQVISLDFAALEARILLYEHGGRCDEADLYQMIARELGYERKAIKGAVISELYGSSKRALGVQLGISGTELDEFVQKIKHHFSTSELLERIKSQFLKTGKITNRYGRPVVVDEPLDNLFISYYGQSTGVDVTLLGFKQVIDTLEQTAPRSKPIFLLHDAIIIDAHKEELDEIRKIQALRIKGYVQRFFLKAENVG